MVFGINQSELSNNVPIRLAVLVLVAVVLFFSPDLRESHAVFTLNFTPDDGSYTSTGDDNNYSCWSVTGISNFNCDNQTYDTYWDGTQMRNADGGDALNGAHMDGTAMYQRQFSSGGKNYYQVIIGKAGDDFRLEYMIEASTSYQRYDGDWAGSASTGSDNSESNATYGMRNPYDANSALHGTGTGNPTRIIMRQILDDGLTYNEFLKDAFDKKPLMKQTIVDADISMEYTLDMRSKTYSDNTPITTAERINKTFLTTNNAANQGDFDSTGATMTPSSMTQGVDNLSAGAFTYTAGGSNGGADGTYTYYDEKGSQDFAGYQPSDKDYSVFCIDTQNVNWSGNGACVNASGSSGGRRGGGGWGGW